MKARLTQNNKHENSSGRKEGISLRVSRAWKNRLVKSAWIENRQPYHVALFLLIHLEMRHKHVFVPRMFKIRNRCLFWPSLGSPRVFLARGKIFRWKVRGLEIVTRII